MQHLTIRRLATLLLVTLFLSLQGLCHIVAQTKFDYEAVDHCSNVFIVNDMGRNGYSDRKPIAELMGTMAEQGADPECILALGDVHHFNGVQSVQDPLWLTNFELIYSHPELMLDWFPILGNHEYRGNTQAVLDYAQVSRRWVMPARYYTHVVEGHGTQIRIIMLDTTPLISKYRKDSQTYPDAVKQDDEAQLRWLDKTLSEATEQWVVVVGHHPVYAQTPKAEDERTDMQKRVGAILERHANVNMYVCGHIHNFQHIKPQGSHVHYVVNSAASLARKVKAIDGTVFCSPEPGFSILSANKNSLTLRMVDKNGNVLHTISIDK